MGIGRGGGASAPGPRFVCARGGGLLPRGGGLGPLFLWPPPLLLLLLPWVIPTALSTLGWWWMFNSLYSVVNWTGLALGIMDPPGPNWLGQRYYAMTAVVVVNIWRGLPFFLITILAGLVSIPRELYEAAEAGRARPGARLWHVTPPLLQPGVAILGLFSTLFTLLEFK